MERTPGQGSRYCLSSLIVEQQGNEMEVDSSPTSSGSSKSSINKEVIQTDSIDIHTEHLERPELLEKLTGLVAQYRFVRLTSPASSGKSSLLKLYQHSLKNANVVWISCLSLESCDQLLLKEGIDFSNKTTTEKLGKKATIVFLDDAQAKYENIEFWGLLIKSSPNWLPSNVRFIISSTHLLSGGGPSPLAFQALPKLERSDFLLDPIESNKFLEMSVIGLPERLKIDKLKQVITRECGGLIGALRQSVDSLKERFAKDAKPSEPALLQHFLSNDLLSNMCRSFGETHSDPIENDSKRFLKMIMVDGVFTKSWTDQQDQDTYSLLKNTGVLIEFPNKTFGFSSQLAKRYYYNKIFPDRAKTTNPSNLEELIRKVIGNMSATILKNSTTPGDFPKEAVFQHLFMEGLARYTMHDCCICPELSKIFPSGIINSSIHQTIPGEIDFYLNGDLRWGIELLVNGDGIGEHIDRFTLPDGKFVSLAVKDYTVVDFRRNSTGQPTNISKHSNRITVFFQKDDYSIAHCIFGQDSDIVEINLSN
jgi:energy-coupling factor transporter ATP-binding protein EcfA2